VKVIDGGNGEWCPWWLGQILKCGECGRTVELEQGDEMLACWMPTHDESVRVSCDRCGNMMRIEREPNAEHHARREAT
jgi:primosomal protein N'